MGRLCWIVGLVGNSWCWVSAIAATQPTEASDRTVTKYEKALVSIVYQNNLGTYKFMNVFFVDAAIKTYKKTLKILISSPACLITGGMIADVLIARSTLDIALNSEPDRDRPHLRNAIPAEKLLQEIEQLDLQLKEQAPRIVVSVDISKLQGVATDGWWWHLDQDHPSPDD